MDDGPMFRRMGIVGAGRVAAAIGLVLAGQSADPVMISGRDPARCRSVAAMIGNASVVARKADLLDACDLIMLAVSDDALVQVTEELARAAGTARGALIFHVSGGSGVALLEPLRVKGYRTAAIHPAMTFTGDVVTEVRRMQGARFAVTASSDAALIEARSIVALLEGVAVDIAEEHRALYHASLCHGANHLVTLITGACKALEAAGVSDPAAVLAPLVRAALENSLERGLSALSGPLQRGDVETISTHLAALRSDCPTLLPAYRVMASATVDALEDAGRLSSPDMRDALIP